MGCMGKKAVPLHAMETLGGRGGISPPFSTSALDGGEWSASRPGVVWVVQVKVNQSHNTPTEA
jgi:hypothetical protein